MTRDELLDRVARTVYGEARSKELQGAGRALVAPTVDAVLAAQAEEDQ